jgi:hypothetical protein
MFDWQADRKLLEQGPFTVRYNHSIPSPDVLNRFLSPDWLAIIADAKLLFENQQRRSAAASLLLKVVVPLALLIPLGLPASWAVALVLVVGAACALQVHGSHLIPLLTQGATRHASKSQKSSLGVNTNDGNNDDTSDITETPSSADLTHSCSLCREKFASHTYVVLHFLKAHPGSTPPLPPDIAAQQKEVHDKQVNQSTSAAAALAQQQPEKKRRAGVTPPSGVTKLAADDDGDSSGDEEDHKRARAPTTIAATVAAQAAAAAATVQSTSTSTTTSTSSVPSKPLTSPTSITFQSPTASGGGGPVLRRQGTNVAPPPLPSTKPNINASGAIAFGPNAKKQLQATGGDTNNTATVALTNEQKQKIEKDKEARRRVRLEITTSEESYVNSLGIIICHTYSIDCGHTHINDGTMVIGMLIAQFIQPLKADPAGYDLTVSDVLLPIYHVLAFITCTMM